MLKESRECFLGKGAGTAYRISPRVREGLQFTFFDGGIRHNLTCMTLKTIWQIKR
jgi:hypothetical protein